ncbi:hypothetical protein DPMN_053883 [Dreissena polymorpha]|uniref:Uncharacterized protein n=1 Tax=Dreissena polymorpha TaxID=45954 RepID=A0A9D4CMZ2_DREPO|nr:hypothetical protein DPMN_053883 [Dreissena polymorpha]
MITITNAAPLAAMFKNKLKTYQKANVFTDFHDNWTINRTSRVLTRFNRNNIMKIAQHPCGPLSTRFYYRHTKGHENCFDPGGNVHEDQTINVVSGVLIRTILKTHTLQRTADKKRSHNHTMRMCSG